MLRLFMRSKLFVPGSRPEWFANALASAADAISIDLEDAVPELQKARAREQVAAFLQSRPALETSKLILVRVNPIGSPHFELDLQAVARRGLGLVNLPKASSDADVRHAVAALALAAAANRAPHAIEGRARACRSTSAWCRCSPVALRRSTATGSAATASA
jgi:citrate lyase subunit beta/citryl-CoA lyase